MATGGTATPFQIDCDSRRRPKKAQRVHKPESFGRSRQIPTSDDRDLPSEDKRDGCCATLRHSQTKQPTSCS